MKFTGMLPGSEGISRGWANWDGSFLQYWRLRGDVLEVYKIMRDIDGLDNQNLYP